MPYHVMTDMGEKAEWDHFEDKPNFQSEVNQCEPVIKKFSATGEALMHIVTSFQGIPFYYSGESMLTNSVMIWSGDIAQFIYDNLD